MTDSHLEEFLAGEAARGLFVDRGTFQLSPEKAIEKISRWRLRDPGLWVVKLVQAAVCAGAAEIQFNFARREVRARFSPPPDWEAEELLGLLLSGAIPSDPARRHLMVGLLGAASGMTQVVEWSCGRHQVRLEARGAISRPLDSSAEVFSLRALRPRKPLQKPDRYNTPLRYLWQQTAHEYKALVDHCRASPIPVRVDRFEVPRSYQVLVSQLPARGAETAVGGRGVMLAQLPLEGPDSLPGLPYPIDEGPLGTLEPAQEKAESVRLQATGKVGAVVCLYSCLHRYSTVNFVHDGARLCQRQLLIGPNLDRLRRVFEDGLDDLVLDVYLGVSWPDLDISEFGVKEMNLSPVLKHALPPIIETLEAIDRDCHLPWNFSTRPPVKPARHQYCPSDFIVLTAVPVLLPILAVIIPPMMIYDALPQKLKQRFEQKKVATLRSRLREVIEGLHRWQAESNSSRVQPGD